MTTDISKSARRFSGLRVAIVHYWFLRWRGGDKVVRSLLKLFPRADIYTLFFDPAACGESLRGHRVVTSALDRGWIRRRHGAFFPLYPWGVRSLHLDQPYDLVISSESGPAKGIAVPPGARHLCYVHSPMRYCWSQRRPYLRAIPWWGRGAAWLGFESLKRWDATTVANVHRYLANSENVKRRVMRYWQRDAAVCHPPIELEHFAPGNLLACERPRQHFLSFGALVPYKDIGLLVEAFNASGRPLVVIGDGPERAKLERRARANIRFVGALDWDGVRRQLAGARALLFPGEEDFGMIPLEVMAYGLPVIALGRGGALETVVDRPGEPERSTGIFFGEPTVEALERAIGRFETLEAHFRPEALRAHARRFGEDHFLRGFAAHVGDLVG